MPMSLVGESASCILQRRRSDGKRLHSRICPFPCILIFSQPLYIHDVRALSCVTTLSWVALCRIVVSMQLVLMKEKEKMRKKNAKFILLWRDNIYIYIHVYVGSLLFGFYVERKPYIEIVGFFFFIFKPCSIVIYFFFLSPVDELFVRVEES